MRVARSAARRQPARGRAAARAAATQGQTLISQGRLSEQPLRKGGDKAAKAAAVAAGTRRARAATNRSLGFAASLAEDTRSASSPRATRTWTWRQATEESFLIPRSQSQRRGPPQLASTRRRTPPHRALPDPRLSTTPAPAPTPAPEASSSRVRVGSQDLDGVQSASADAIRSHKAARLGPVPPARKPFQIQIQPHQYYEHRSSRRRRDAIGPHEHPPLRAQVLRKYMISWPHSQSRPHLDFALSRAPAPHHCPSG